MQVKIFFRQKTLAQHLLIRITLAEFHLMPLGNFRGYLLVLLSFLVSQFSERKTRFCCSMWRHIGDNPRYVQLDEVSSFSNSISNGGNSSDNAIKRPLAATVRQPLDWSSSSCGLFTGLLSLVALIINLIVYFALVNQVRIICRIPKRLKIHTEPKCYFLFKNYILAYCPKITFLARKFKYFSFEN